MIQWNKIVGYDKQKDYRWQNEKVILDDVNRICNCCSKVDMDYLNQ